MPLADSSVIVKAFSKEPGWEEALHYVSESFTISFALAELGSALLKKSEKKEISLSIAMELLGGYSKRAILLDQNDYLISAFKIAIENHISIYNSLFIAAAFEENLDLVSCDKEQIKISERLGIKTIKC